jgi:adenylosuccinate lyase
MPMAVLAYEFNNMQETMIRYSLGLTSGGVRKYKYLSDKYQTLQTEVYKRMGIQPETQSKRPVQQDNIIDFGKAKAIIQQKRQQASRSIL